MRIARLRITGFRGVKEADLRLGKTAVLVGPNSVGKTTVIEALALLLGRDGMVRGLTEHDFYGSSPTPSDRIKILATVVGFPHPNPDQVPEWFAMKRAGVPKWFDPTTGSESATYKPAPYELACEVGFQARFDHENLEVETLRYFCDDAAADDVFIDDTVTPINIGLVRDIGLFLIPASRSWDRMMSFGSELFRRVVSSDNGLPAESVLAERNRLRTPAEPLEDDRRLKPVIDEVNKEIAALFGEGREVQLRLTPTDSAGVLDAVVPHFKSPGSAAIPSKREGSGLISLQSLFLLLHFGTRRIENGKGFCLALEEPELHLPPTLQRRVLRRLRALSTQVIVSTHSPLIAGFSDPTEVLIVANESGVVTARALLEKPLDATTPNALRTLIQLKRVEVAGALMAETVLVPEGVLDYEWLSLIARIVEAQADTDAPGALYAASIGVVPTHDGAVIETSKCLAKAHGHVVPIVDGDAAGVGYAATLAAAGFGRLLRWPDTWTIEDAIGWIIGTADAQVLTTLGANIPNPPANTNDLIARLKNDDRHDPMRLKGDRLAYESVASGIAATPEALRRAGELLDAIARAARRSTTPRFVQSPSAPSTFVFQP
ncbi:MAG TPA: AAA family ATPase [Caulobacteraceae bacterium]|jgi:ABC-type cobalamin/Fe3+-siderophores transport system ATPase subunit|nr:AAA family ATPase [Caulobacteraceae bacterium]